MADDGGLAHGKHGTHGRIFDRRERRGRKTDGRRTAEGFLAEHVIPDFGFILII
jgi:hypothetical protein